MYHILFEILQFDLNIQQFRTYLAENPISLKTKLGFEVVRSPEFSKKIHH